MKSFLVRKSKLIFVWMFQKGQLEGHSNVVIISCTQKNERPSRSVLQIKSKDYSLVGCIKHGQKSWSMYYFQAKNIQSWWSRQLVVLLAWFKKRAAFKRCKSSWNRRNHVLGRFGALGKTEQVYWSKNMNSESYTTLLDNHLIPSLPLCVHQDPIFQQDNAPIHKSRHSMAFL